MSSYKSFEELAEAAKQTIEGMKKRPGFYEGVIQQITDPYTDNAHFILELLQNAEDMKATTARFRLEKDCLYFDHNGTKRDFNLDDIDAITNIANNAQKQTDEEVIGKFGIGFKAVFLYTDTPIIHSGEYHFKIIDLFVPSKEGVEIKPTIVNGEHWTYFELPFNSNKKKQTECYEEISDGLMKLDYGVLLFLRSIQRIEIIMGSTRLCLSKTEEPFSEGSFLVKIQTEGKDDLSSWVRFTKPFEYEEKGNVKRLPVSLAYKYRVNEKEGIEFEPISDRRSVYIFFPAEKEDSGLKFPINGPFLTTSARNALRTGNPINKRILEVISDLACESFQQLKEKGWLNPSFLYLMPNGGDSISPDYEDIARRIKQEFASKEIVPALEGGYVKGEEAAMWTRDNMSILKDADMEELGLYANILTVAKNNGNNVWDPVHRRFQYAIQSRYWRGAETPRKRWVPTFRSNDRIMRFYEDISVLSVEAGIHDAFNIQLSGLNDWMKNQTKRKIADFYLLLKTLTKRDNEHFPTQPVAIDKEGTTQYSDSIVWVRDRQLPPVTQSHIFDPYFITPSEEIKNDEADKIFAFITNNLQIQEYSDLEEMRALVKDLSAVEEANDVYFEKLSVLAMFFDDLVSKNGQDTVLEIYKDIPLLCDDGIMRPQAEVSLGSEYGENRNDVFASALKRIDESVPLLSNVYLDPANAGGEDLKAFFGKLKFKDVLQIVQNNDIWKYPLVSKIRSGKSRENNKKVFEDYEIHNLKKILELGDAELDCEILKFITELPIDEQKKYSKARYRANAHAVMNVEDSSIVFVLKTMAWVLGKDGNLHKPSDISLNDIEIETEVDAALPLIKALQFGSSLDELATKEKECKEFLRKRGKIILDEDEKDDFDEFKKWKTRRSNRRRQSYTDALNGESKGYIGQDDEADFDEAAGGVTNPERRQSKIEEELSQEEKSAPRATLVTRKANISEEEKDTLRQWYGGKCQICDTVIKKRNGEPYFEATNIVPTNILLEEYDTHNDLCWNSLCLCPNCSAKYKFSAKDVRSIERIADTEYDFADDELHEIHITLAGEMSSIKFTSKHLLAIQAAQKKFRGK